MEQDLSTTLVLLTPEGLMRLPLRALARRALPTVHAPGGVVEVGARGGGVMVAARAERSVTLTNAGALDVTYEIRVAGQLAATAEEVDEAEEAAPAAGGGNGEGGGSDDVAAAPAGDDTAGGAGSTTGVGAIRVAGFTLRGARGVIPGYGQAAFAVEFAPLVPGARVCTRNVLPLSICGG